MKLFNTKKDKSIVSHFLIVGIGVFINMALGLITTPIITRIADPSEYGRFTIFNTYSSILISIAFLGLDAALIRFFYDYKKIEDKRKLLNICISLPIIICALIFAILFIFTKFNIQILKLSSAYMLILFLFVIVNLFNTISINLLRLTYNSNAYSICTIVQKVVYCLVIVSLLFIKTDDYVLILILANIISFAISIVLAIAITKEYWRFDYSEALENRKEVLSYSIPLMVFNIVYTLFDSLDKLLVNRFCSETEVGIYSSALTIVGMILLIKTTFDAIWYPAQTEHFTNDLEDKEFIRKGNKYITILMFFVGLSVIMFKDILCLILGGAYRDASQVVPFLIFNPIMSTISLTTVSGIEISKKSYLQIIIALICLAIHYLSGIYFIPLLGLKGAAISLSISYIALYVLRLCFSNKYYYIDYDFKKSLLLILITLIFAYINSFYSVTIVTVIVYLASLIIMFALYKNDIYEMLTFIKGNIIKKDE